MNRALLLIDLQNDYFENGKAELSGAKGASEKAKQVLDQFRNAQLPVIHIQHLSTRPGATFFIPGTKGSEIQENVLPVTNEKIIVKHHPNSFRETELLDYLKQKNITDLVILGMMTHMCVDATTRAAKDYGFNCVVIGDACATKDLEIDSLHVAAEEVQKAFLAALNYYYSTVKNTKEFLRDWQ